MKLKLRVKSAASLAVLGIALGASTAVASPTAAPVARPSIVGGATAPTGSFGMMAFVLHVAPDGTADFACSGTVISSNVVLTAGHCGEAPSGVAYAASGYRIVTTALDWTNSARQVSGVSRVVVSPSFDPSTLDGDAALLILDTATPAPAVPLAVYPGDASLLAPGTATEIGGGA